ncbi:MAG TPA: phage baseplate assembly protein V [Thermoanaerobaculia bacterium]|nr:phage baseplate assembly protein V [Thermoanaerobaculia bacterium]
MNDEEMEDSYFYGKYRGTVINNIDPLQIGRIQVTVPDVSGSIPSSWAMPCVPITGKQMGIFVVPQVGAGVWVEFEQGDPDYPIWVGGFWGSSSELPSAAKEGLPVSPSIVLQTAGQNSIVISDLPGTGGIELKSRTGAKITIDDTGITIDNGKGASVKLTGPSVDINSGALKVT